MVTTEQQTTTDPVFADVPGHGNTVASWSMFGIMFAGFLVGCIAFIYANTMGLIVGGAIIVLGAIVGVVLKAAGYGVGGKHTTSGH